MSTILSYSRRFLSFFISTSIIVLTLLIFTGCAHTSKKFFKEISHLHKEITIITCPSHFNSLKKKLQKNQKLYCWVFTPPNSTSATPASLAGIWISNSLASTHPPLFFIPNGPETTYFFQTEREITNLTSLAQTVAWKHDFIAFTPRSYTPQTFSLKCEKALYHLKNSQNNPSTRGFEYQNFFTSCVNELQENSITQTFHPFYYSSTIFAQDILAFLQTLKYKKVILVARSYGTRTALELMYRAPQKIERALFEHIHPIDYHPLDDLPWTLENILARLEYACARNETCKRKFNRNFTHYLNSTLERLEKNPLLSQSSFIDSFEKPLSQNELKETLGYYIDAHGYLNFIISQLYSKEGIATLPILLSEGKQGRYFPETEKLNQTLTVSKQNNQPHALMKSVFYHLWLCNDRYAFPQSFDSNSLTANLAQSKLPHTIKNIIKEEWEASPCKNFKNHEISSKISSFTSPLQPYSTPIENPLLILNAEMNPRLAPQLVQHPSFQATQTSNILFYGEIGQLLFKNTCAQETAKYFLNAPQEQIVSNNFIQTSSKQLPCLNKLKQETFPFKIPS